MTKNTNLQIRWRFKDGFGFALGLPVQGYIYFTLPEFQTILHTSILRFILFDGAGLLLLLFAWLTLPKEAKLKTA